MRRSLFHAVAQATLILVLLGCGDRPQPPPPTPAPAAPAAGDSRALTPSAAPQTLAFDGGLRITVPPALVTEPVRLTVNRAATPPPAPAAGPVRLDGHDVTLGDRHALAGELRLTWPYDPARLPDGVPPAAGLIAGRYDRAARTWVELPIEVDAAARTVTARTRHLSWVEVYYLGRAYKALPGGTFGVFYDEALTRAGVDPDYRARHANPHPGVPDFVNDVHQFADAALTAYARHGLTPYSTPVYILVCGKGSSEYNRVLRRAFITFDAHSSPELQYVVGHELFHAVQLAAYDTTDYVKGRHKWWLEASAEYAAARIPMHYRKMGKGTEGPMPPKLLTHGVGLFGETSQADLARYHQYHQAFLLEWLARAARQSGEASVQHSWAAMYAHVAARRGGSALAALDDFLKTRLGPANGLDRQFRAFALHYLLDPGSPMGRAKVTGDGVHPVALEGALAVDVSGGKGVEYTLGTAAGHTARMWSLDVRPAGADLSVSLGAPLPDRMAVYVARLPGGNRTGHVVAARFEGRADTRPQPVTAGTADRRVLVIVNDGERRAEVTVRLVPERRPTLTLPERVKTPAGVAFELTATVARAPAGARFQWIVADKVHETDGPRLRHPPFKYTGEHKLSVTLIGRAGKQLAWARGLLVVEPGTALIWERSYTPDKVLSLEYQVRAGSGIQHGQYRRYHADGKQLYEEAEYVDGKRLWFVTYHVDGTRSSEGRNDAQGRRTGLWASYAKNGKPRERVHWLANQRHGAYERYHGDSGQPKELGSYVRGIRDGTWRSFFPPGKDGKAGGPHVVCTLAGGKLDGTRSEYWQKTGKLKRQTDYRVNVRHGFDRHHDIDGQLYREEEYVQDRLVVRRIYDKGTLKSEERPGR